MGSDNWNASGCKGLSPMITIQPTTDVILLGSVLNWKTKNQEVVIHIQITLFMKLHLSKKIFFFFHYTKMVLIKTYIQK